ncbi:MAG: SurA N-terminal domain-containing protein [Acidocella sp.]|nr:SurA N-terminal domain-containing protein [Acidocella sp.]
MLYWVRSLKGSWIARVFSVLLMLVFVAWGASSALPLMTGGVTAVAHIGGKPVDISEVQAEYQSELNKAQQNGAPDQATRQQIAQSALATVLRQHAMALEEQAVGIAAPDSAVRSRIYAIPAFQTNGTFDQAKFASVLQQNGYSQDRFLALETDSVKTDQLIPSIVSGASPPQELVNQIFNFISQSRTAEMVTIPVTSQPSPATPSDAELQRYWKNHPAQFTAPEYRTAKIVVLSPQVLAHNEAVSDAKLQALYARISAQRSVPATRSVQVITSDSPATAAKLAALWQAGADWTKIQAAAKDAGASTVQLDHAQANQIPSPALEAAVFAATPGAVTGPVQGDIGNFVFKVTDAQAGGAPSLASLTPELKAQIQLQEAQDQVAKDVDNVQDALAGQTPLDQLPGNLDLAAVQGTLDANGNTTDGTPAPIPGGDKLRAAIVKAIFAAHVGDAAQLVSGPDGGYFAFTLDSITPPAVQPYDQVKAQVAAAWTQDAQAREAEVKAADLLHAVNTGKSLDQLADADGYSVEMSAPQTRVAQPSGMTSQMEQILFSLKLGQATMQQTDSGFVVAVLAKIDQPTPAQDPTLVAQLQQSLTKSLQNDVAESFLGGLQARDKVSVDPKLFAQIYQ